MQTNTYLTIDSAAIMDTITSTLAAAGVGEFTSNTTRVSGKGSQHVIRISLPNLRQVFGNEVLTPQILIFNSYRGESAFQIMVGFIRFACSNGMVVGDVGYRERIIHRVGDTAERKLAQLATGVAGAVEYVANGGFAALYDECLQPLTDAQAYDIIGNLPQLSNRMKDRAIVRWTYPSRDEDRGCNVWSLWNICNEIIREGSKSQYRQDVRNVALLEDIQLLVA